MTQIWKNTVLPLIQQKMIETAQPQSKQKDGKMSITLDLNLRSPFELQHVSPLCADAERCKLYLLLLPLLLLLCEGMQPLPLTPLHVGSCFC